MTIPRAFVPFQVFLAIAPCVRGHGFLTVPEARNGGNSGASGGGAAVYDGGVQHNFKHGICGDGNSEGTPQKYAEVGPIKAVYREGQTINAHVQITAHHMGYFEFDLCPNAGNLTEECFAEHHLLREGCSCDCGTLAPSPNSNDCEGCLHCRRWWKPLVEGELLTGAWAARNYEGPVLPGAGNLKVYIFVVKLKIPTGTASQNAVLRWHWRTTNSCTSGFSAPEEFWNCADVTIKDANGNAPEVSYSNDALRTAYPENLVPKMQAGKLPGVDSGCPTSSSGELMGVADKTQYEFCGQAVTADQGHIPWQFCYQPGTHQSNETCGVTTTGVVCQDETWYFQCVDGSLILRETEPLICCRDNQFVPCVEPTPPPTEAGPTPPPTEPPNEEGCTQYDAPAKTGNSQGCTDSACARCGHPENYQWWPCNTNPNCCTCVGQSVTPPPTPPTPPGPPTPPEPEPEPISCADANGHACRQCLASNGVCYPESKQWCDMYPQFDWCGHDDQQSCTDWSNPQDCGTTLFGLSKQKVQIVTTIAGGLATAAMGWMAFSLAAFAFRWVRGRHSRFRLISTNEETLTAELEAPRVTTLAL